ncbi:MAG: intradiol ring-cleavage dioxygenase [Chloroflexi bacterium]|nr:intradiol ring-cleavage dioxygenase [Chloroflexota bacterium]MCI0575172.1 intradiol ring-cleavage dioxygenase [Chloroflexota bacterium]MCI0647146.1 intradiol ring-cleavage dioxygenase [Chloroflexota bacterium]MCI0729978.1 intradiol ring-cleavage dioxygenase [Chloroflexota bacterium]
MMQADNDDVQIGRILSRREVLRLLGATGIVLLVGCGPGESDSAQPTSTSGQAPAGGATATPALSPEAVVTEEAAANATTAPACVVRPELTEGPYFVDVALDRSDIRSDPATGVVKEGALLALTFNVSQVSNGNCSPLPGVVVDIWHCDALGVYSAVSDPGFDTSGQQFLRGYQVTDANGAARFTTIYPGWYSGRTVHIHFKIRTDPDSDEGYEFTSQLFFDETLSDEVHSQEPYASKGPRDTLNNTDNIYNDLLLLTVNQTAGGYAATFDIGLDLADSSTGQPDGFR